jgi:hypothetical protein
MKDLKESLLGNTKSKLRNMPETIKRAQLQQLGFPDFEDEFDGWVWVCPEIMERNESNILKLTDRKKTYYGFWMEIIPAVFDKTKKQVFSISIDAITDRTGETPWMGNQILVSFIIERDMKVAYEFFQLFALNVDEMIKDFVKLGDDYDMNEVYQMLMKKYGK